MAKRRTNRNRAQVTRLHNQGMGPVIVLTERTANSMAKRKTNRKHKAKARRRRANGNGNGQARVASSSSQARYTNRSHRPKQRRRRNGVPRQTNASRATEGAGALLVTAGGIVGVDMLTQKFLGAQSGLAGAAIKIGAGYLVESLGSRAPLVGQHAQAIGFVLKVIGVVDLVRQFVLPQVAAFAPSLIPAGYLPAPAPQPNPQPTTGMQGLVNIPNDSDLLMGGQYAY
jgi:hypothetical protein